MDIKTQLTEIKSEPNNITKRLESIEKRLETLEKTINDMVKYREFKKRIKSSIMSWIKVAPVLIGAGLLLVGYLSYEAGLYKPIPTHITQR